MEKLPKNWIGTTLGEICSHPQYGWTTQASQIGDVRFVRITDISSGKISWESVPFCTTPPDDFDKYKLSKNDILIARTGASVGNSFRIEDVPNKAVFASYLIRFNAVLVLPELVEYCLKTDRYWAFISDYSSGSAQPNVNAVKLSQFPISLPPLAEQRRIIAKLDAALERLRAVEAVLKEVPGLIADFRRSVLHWAVTGKLTENWRREKGTKAKWAKKRLGDLLISIEAGKNFKCLERPPDKNEVGVVKVSSVSWGKYQENESKTCIDQAKVNTRYIIQNGDFLISRANTTELVGACVIAKGVSKRVMLSDKILRLNFKKAALKEWMLIYLRSKEGRQQIEQFATGTQASMKNISQPKIRSIKAQIPSGEELELILESTEKLFQTSDRFENTLAEIKKETVKLRQNLLAQAFRGELLSAEELSAVQSEPDFEPAWVLLEKIKLEKERIAGEMGKEGGKKRSFNIVEKKSKLMSDLNIKQVLQSQNGKPMKARDVWKASKYREDKEIDSFYEELRQVVEIEKSVLSRVADNQETYLRLNPTSNHAD